MTTFYKTIKKACLVVTTLSCFNSSNGFTNDLVAHYTFNEGSGTAAADTSSWKQDATVHGSGSSWVVGKWGAAIDITGTGDYIESTVFNDEFQPETITAMAWINPDTGSSTDFHYIISKIEYGTGGFALALDADTDKLVGKVWRESAQQYDDVYSNTLISDNTWTHVAMTYDGSELKIYVNGVVQTDVANVSGDIAETNYNLTIGDLSNSAPSDTAFIGAIDDVRIYDYGMSGTEVTDIQTALAGEPGLVFYEPFDFWGTVVSNGLLSEKGTTAFVSSPLGGGLEMDDNTIVSLPTANNLDLDKGTISFWIKPNWDGDDGFAHPILEMINSGNSEFKFHNTLFFTTNYLSFLHDGDDSGSSDAHTADSAFIRKGYTLDWTAGEWHYIELHWDATVEDAYMALVIDDRFPLVLKYDLDSGGVPASKLFLGSSDTVNGDGMDAVMDELKIYDSPTIDRNNLHAGYIDRTRNDGTIQTHESPGSSYDAPTLSDTIAQGQDFVFFQKPPYVTVDANTLPVSNEVSSTMEYKAAKGETLSLFF